jgi:hypothetical protein
MARKKTTTKPPTEIALGEMQERMLRDPEKKVPEDYFFLLKNYARSITLKKIKSKQIFLPPERVDEIATEATLLMLNQYKKPGWKVDASFHGVLQWKVVEAMYGDASEDITTSLNLVIGDNANQEVADIFKKLGAVPPWLDENPENDPANLFMKSVDISFEEIQSVIREASEVLPYHMMLLFYVYLLLRLRRPKTRLTFPSFKKFFLDSKSEDVFDLLMLEIRNRIASHVI